LSLYYGSIGISDGLLAIWLWTTNWLMTSHFRDAALRNAVRSHQGDSSVFSFGTGRSALAACLKAAEIGSGSEVLLSAYTCLAVPTAVVAVGAKPVYLDINSETLNVDADCTIAALSPHVRAVVVQHTLGKVAPIEAIMKEAKQRGILVIEDCALALGSSINGRKVGTFGDAAIFSMELSKTISCGWGGILVVNNPSLANAVSTYYVTIPEQGWWSSTRDLWQTVISAWCYNAALFDSFGKYVLALGFRYHFFRVSTPAEEFEGSISPQFIRKLGSAQTRMATLQWRRTNDVASICANNAQVIRRALLDLNLQVPGAPTSDEISVAPRVSFLVTDRSHAISYFEARGIALGRWFDGPLSPVPKSPLFNYHSELYPVAEKIAANVVNLPCHSGIQSDDLVHLVATLNKFVHDQPGCAI
jgi:perosamine synthetase